MTEEQRLEIFIDDSNLWIEAQRMMAKVTGACKFDPRARVNIRELLAVLTHRKAPSGTQSTSIAAPSHSHSPLHFASPSSSSSSSSAAASGPGLKGVKRIISHSTIYGSQAKSLPPEAQGVWKHLSNKGLTVKAASRGNKLNREKGIDAQIASDITETIVGSWSPSSVLVLVAGDGDYTPLILKALKRNWKVEVWFWEHSHSKSLSPSNPLFRPFQSFFSFHPLDPFLLDIAYLSWNWKGEICKEKSIVLSNIPPTVSEEVIERALHDVALAFNMPDLIPHYERKIDHSRAIALVFPHIDGTPHSLHRLFSALVSSYNPTLSCCSISTFLDYERRTGHSHSHSHSHSSSSSSSSSHSSRRSAAVASSRVPIAITIPSPAPSSSLFSSPPETNFLATSSSYPPSSSASSSSSSSSSLSPPNHFASNFFEMSLPSLFQGFSLDTNANPPSSSSLPSPPLSPPLISSPSMVMTLNETETGSNEEDIESNLLHHQSMGMMTMMMSPPSPPSHLQSYLQSQPHPQPHPHPQSQPSIPMYGFGTMNTTTPSTAISSSLMNNGQTFHPDFVQTFHSPAPNFFLPPASSMMSQHQNQSQSQMQGQMQGQIQGQIQGSLFDLPPSNPFFSHPNSNSNLNPNPNLNPGFTFNPFFTTPQTTARSSYQPPLFSRRPTNENEGMSMMEYHPPLSSLLKSSSGTIAVDV